LPQLKCCIFDLIGQISEISKPENRTKEVENFFQEMLRQFNGYKQKCDELAKQNLAQRQNRITIPEMKGITDKPSLKLICCPPNGAELLDKNIMAKKPANSYLTISSENLDTNKVKTNCGNMCCWRINICNSSGIGKVIIGVTLDYNKLSKMLFKTSGTWGYGSDGAEWHNGEEIPPKAQEKSSKWDEETDFTVEMMLSEGKLIWKQVIENGDGITHTLGDGNFLAKYIDKFLLPFVSVRKGNMKVRIWKMWELKN